MKISELAAVTQVPTKTIRYYEHEGLLPEPKRGANGYRYYGQQDVDTLIFIRRCRSLNIALSDIRKLVEVQKQPQGCCSVVDDIIAEQLAKIQQTQRELAKLEASLTALITCEHHKIEDCSILQRLKQAECC